MSFFKKLKDRMFKSSSKLDEGLDAIIEDGAVEEAAVDETAVDDTAVDRGASVPEAIPTQHARQGDPFRLDLADFFLDQDGDTIAYSVSGLPGTLKLGPGTGVVDHDPSSTSSPMPCRRRWSSARRTRHEPERSTARA